MAPQGAIFFAAPLPVGLASGGRTATDRAKIGGRHGVAD